MTKADEDAIREIELRFNEAWGRHDADAMVESLADDAQFVTVNGAWTTTRADYLNLMQRLHGSGGPFRTSTRETPIMHVRFLAPDVATYMAILKNLCALGLVRASCRKIDGRWRTAAVQNTDVRAGRRH
ncbi:MAG: SgcJ/EcaC family oxidoreductase [Pseudolabrys sp.]